MWFWIFQTTTVEDAVSLVVTMVMGIVPLIVIMVTGIVELHGYGYCTIGRVTMVTGIVPLVELPWLRVLYHTSHLHRGT